MKFYKYSAFYKEFVTVQFTVFPSLNSRYLTSETCLLDYPLIFRFCSFTLSVECHLLNEKHIDTFFPNIKCQTRILSELCGD